MTSWPQSTDPSSRDFMIKFSFPQLVVGFFSPPFSVPGDYYIPNSFFQTSSPCFQGQKFCLLEYSKCQLPVIRFHWCSLTGSVDLQVPTTGHKANAPLCDVLSGSLSSAPVHPSGLCVAKSIQALPMSGEVLNYPLLSVAFQLPVWTFSQDLSHQRTTIPLNVCSER